MTIQEAIAHLQRVATKHGSDTLVFFDCPHCKTAFTPDYVATTAVHFEADPNLPSHQPKSQ